MKNNTLEILLIEDNLPDAEYLSELLSEERNPVISIMHAGRLSEGLSYLDGKRFDAVLLDLGLPDSQGMQTLLRARKQNAHVPIIILTGLSDEEFAVKAIHSGADEYLIKAQIDRTLLVRTIRYTMERKRILEELRSSEEQYRVLFESNPLPMWVYCRESLSFLAVNNAAIQHYGYSREEFLGMSLKDIHQPEELPRLLIAGKETSAPLRYSGIWKHRRKDGSVIDVNITTNDVLFKGRAARLALAEDVTELKKAEETIKYQAYHDMLTGLPNRAQLMLKIGLELAQAKRNQKQVAVLHLDLDRFRAINESLGHAMGDMVIRQVAGKLKDLVRESDTLARTGGDEFMILLADLDRPEDAAVFARTLIAAMREPLNTNGHTLYATASIGISMSPEDGENPDVLLKYADIAVSAAKKHGRNNYQFFNPEINIRTVERLLLESDLRQSIERNELSLHYQPQVSIRTGKIIGFEALVRWKHPRLGLLNPSQFVPIAEEMGFITMIDEWVMKTASFQLKEWHDGALSKLCMSVNLSSEKFHDPALLDLVSGILRKSRLDPGYFEIEITESTAMRDIDLAVPKLKGLHEMGVNIAIDDFGTGYSSLSYLKRFPVKKLKIDQSFIRGVPGDPDDQAIVNAVIALGHQMKLIVIAEGVETREQLSFLRSNQCDEMQGFLFSEPVGADEIGELLRK